jgi:hypothetical protein
MTQYAVPNADTLTGDWTETGAGSDFFAQIDETPVASVDDLDYISVVETDPVGVDGVARFALSDITDPEDDTDQIVRFRAKASWTMTAPTLTVLLLDGSDSIRTQSETLTTGWVDYSFTLTADEADDITADTGYGDLSLRITAGLGAVGGDSVDVSQLFFETNDAPAGGGGTVNSASDNFSLIDNFGNHFSLE